MEGGRKEWREGGGRKREGGKPGGLEHYRTWFHLSTFVCRCP